MDNLMDFLTQKSLIKTIISPSRKWVRKIKMTNDSRFVEGRDRRTAFFVSFLIGSAKHCNVFYITGTKLGLGPGKIINYNLNDPNSIVSASRDLEERIKNWAETQKPKPISKNRRKRLIR